MEIKTNTDQAALEECNPAYGMLVVNWSKLTLLQRTNWIEDPTNADLICRNPPVRRSNHTHDYLMVSLRNFHDERAQFEWLKANSAIFCLAESYDYIEQSHRVPENHNPLRTAIDLSTKRASKTIAELEQLGVDFTSGYESFLQVAINEIDQLEVRLINEYTADAVFYSIPFLKSLIVQFMPSDGDPRLFAFEFVTADYEDADHNAKSTIAFRVLFGGVQQGQFYYDYSTQPGHALAQKGHALAQPGQALAQPGQASA